MNTRQTRQTAGRWIVRSVVAAALSVALIAPTVPALAAPTVVVVARQAADDQTNVGGGVTVKVSRQDAADAIAFKVVLDTHSVNLDTYDLVQLAVLRTPSGEEIAPLAWDAPAGGHHREGALSFPAVAADGSPLVQPDGGQLVLVIRDIAGVAERTFSWAA
jgi:hypothetical protein